MSKSASISIGVFVAFLALQFVMFGSGLSSLPPENESAGFRAGFYVGMLFWPTFLAFVAYGIGRLIRRHERKTYAHPTYPGPYGQAPAPYLAPQFDPGAGHAPYAGQPVHAQGQPQAHAPAPYTEVGHPQGPAAYRPEAPQFAAPQPRRRDHA